MKVVNPGGISTFKFNQRSLDVDEKHVHYGITPRDVLKTLTRALTDLRVPHPLHVYSSNLGVPGNIESTIKTMDAAEGLPIHLTHIQFHSYGAEGPRKFSSGTRIISEAVNTRPNVTIDVGQIIFGQTVTASGNTMMQFKNAPLANPRKWTLGDIECDAGCGIVPFKYREQSYVNALQWIIGLEIFLLVDDPWRVSMTTDHPNGAPFTSYPHLIRLLMDKSFPDEQLDKLHADAKTAGALAEITREFSLYDIAIITRAGPARLLGLTDRGHLGAGAAADIAVYRDEANCERMFTSPAYMFKDGELIARDGTLLKTPAGGIHYVMPDYDRAIEKRVRAFTEANLASRFENASIGNDEVCSFCKGGRALAGRVLRIGSKVTMMRINDTQIDDTFAEAFPMKATRLIITAHNATWARYAANSLTGFATSVIDCGCKAGIERDLSRDETPDGRPGISVLIFAVSSKELAKQIARRVGQCVLTCPTTAVYGGIDPATSREPLSDVAPLGSGLRFFDDGWQISKVLDGARYWRVPVMDGEFVCEELTATVKAVGGGNLLFLARNMDSALQVAEAAIAAMHQLPNVISRRFRVASCARVRRSARNMQAQRHRRTMRFVPRSCACRRRAS